MNWPSETNILVSSLWLIGSLAFFAGFIFPRVVKRNLHRACRASRRHPALVSVLHALLVDHHGGYDSPSASRLRALDLVPHSFITGFYTGLGLSLMLSTYPYLRLLFRPKR